MVRRLIPAALFLCLVTTAAHAAFHDTFLDRTMRIDYYHIGHADMDVVALDRIYDYGIWAGSLTTLIDDLNYGAYYHKVYDDATDKLIYSRGFDSYFKEYSASGPGNDHVVKTFHESAMIPRPKGKFIFALEHRENDGTFQEVFRTTIDPDDVAIVRDRGADLTVKVFTSQKSGDPHMKADVAIIAEGYTAAEQGKFEKDLKRFTETFFKQEPCKSHRSSFNVYGVFKPSAESGIDEPRHGSFKTTSVGGTFNAMGSERYVLTEDNRALRDIARHVPYDALYIMINHSRYGGGGIYNFYCTYTADNQWSEYLMVHEFGHSFFGLADEYYTSSTAYEDFYPRGYEPAEPNITALNDRANVKWKHLLTPGVAVPTPWEKAGYDSIALAWKDIRETMNNRVAELTKKHAPASEIRAAQKEYNQADRAWAERMEKYLASSRYAGKVGAFEGAGYTSQGLFRPMADCIMFTKTSPVFCRVCADAMVGILDRYTK